ncbi:helix-turn-helix domain-containing protein [Gloeothece verrucosa]|nr:helix-turn-helix domain-containing protein [Gloeothece verrucosa]
MSLKSHHNPNKNSLVVTHEFDDIDLFTEALKPLTIVANQTSPGLFKGKINHFRFSGLQFTSISQNQSLYAKGPKSSCDRTFAITFQSRQTSVIAHGIAVKKSDLFGFDLVRPVDVIVEKDTQIVLANVNLQAFESLAEKMGYEGFEFMQNNLVSAHPATFRYLREYYGQISQLLAEKPELIGKAPFQALIRQDFLPLLLDTLGAISRRNQKVKKPFRRYSLVKKALEIALSFPEQPLTLEQLCNKLETSSSALAYGFQDIFGLSPIAYIKIQRLNGVRRLLKRADPKTTTVMQVAQQWGFWSFSHFARDYKKMFGELPSQTLQKGVFNSLKKL